MLRIYSCNGSRYDSANAKLVLFPTINDALNADIFPSLFVSDTGKIFVTSGYNFNANTFNRQGQVALIVKPDGINNFVGTNIQGPFLINQANLSWVDGTTPPWQFARGLINLGALRQVAYDNLHNILYHIWSDVDYDEYDRTNAKNLYFAFSEDDGHTWSPRFLINDSGTNTRGLISISIDQTNGNLYFDWYDARNSPIGPDGQDGKFVEKYATLIPFSRIKPYLKSTHACEFINRECHRDENFVKSRERFTDYELPSTLEQEDNS